MDDIFTEYITEDGDRIDMIAYKAYGDATRGKEILDQNSWLPIVPEYSGGIRLLIKVDQKNTKAAQETLLPPWKK